MPDSSGVSVDGGSLAAGRARGSVDGDRESVGPPLSSTAEHVRVLSAYHGTTDTEQ